MSSDNFKATVDLIPGDFDDPEADFRAVRETMARYHNQPISNDLRIEMRDILAWPAAGTGMTTPSPGRDCRDCMFLVATTVSLVRPLTLPVPEWPTLAQLSHVAIEENNYENTLSLSYWSPVPGLLGTDDPG
ncbi:MAG: hypothetical protein ACR2P1_09325 [Pseudomonadales bacterium]